MTNSALVGRCRQQLNYMIALLQGEISDLKKGDFSKLDVRSKEKLAGMKLLSQSLQQLQTPQEKSVIEPLMARLNRLSNENGLLLKSVFNGAKAARARIETLQAEAGSAGVYGRNGQAVKLPESYIRREKSV